MKPQQVSLITPTGARPEAFALCEKWIKNQVQSWPLYEISSWVVVDDVPSAPTKCTMGQKYYKGPKVWTPEHNYQRYNLDLALEKATGDVIFVIEDDEKYSPNYISSMLALLETAEIAGISNSRYYHVGIQGYKTMGNYSHSSLCHTAVRGSAKHLLSKAIHSGEFYFDIALWLYAKEKEIPLVLLANSDLSVGVKGMPGRAGLGAGHADTGYKSDRDLSVLKSWMGSDYKYYLDFVKK